MSKKRIAIAIFSLILISFLSLKLFNQACKLSGWCNPVFLSYYLPKKEGKLYYDVIFEAKNPSKEVFFKSFVHSKAILSGRDFEVKYILENLTDKKLTVRPRRYVEPVGAMKYLEFYECLCFKEYNLAPNEVKELVVKFRIDPKIEDDKSFGVSRRFIRIGYEIVD